MLPVMSSTPCQILRSQSQGHRGHGCRGGICVTRTHLVIIEMTLAMSFDCLSVSNEKYEGIYRDRLTHQNIMHCRLGMAVIKEPTKSLSAIL